MYLYYVYSAQSDDKFILSAFDEPLYLNKVNQSQSTDVVAPSEVVTALQDSASWARTCEVPLFLNDV